MKKHDMVRSIVEGFLPYQLIFKITNIIEVAFSGMLLHDKTGHFRRDRVLQSPLVQQG